MRISDWSSDVCSSDLRHQRLARAHVPLKQAEHGLALRHVPSNRFVGAALSARGREGQLQPCPQMAVPLYGNTAPASCRCTDQHQGKLPREDFIIGKSLTRLGMGRTAMDGMQRLPPRRPAFRSAEHTSEIQTPMRISYAVLC